jgi:acetyltransferase-like isoleucine patch superfamily enzyme
MKFLLIKICHFVSFFFSYSLFRRYKETKERLYTYWIENQFKQIGNSCTISCPIYLTGGNYISIGSNFGTKEGLRLEALDKYQKVTYTPCIQIGNNVKILYNCHIGAINEIIIKDNVLIGSNVLITDHSHGDTHRETLIISPNERKLFSKGSVIIEENVWIGENVVILPNVIVGKNSIIGAGSVVNSSIPPFSIVVGNPARIVKTLYE